MPCYKSMHHNGYSTRSNTVVPLQNTLYFMGRSRSDTQEYKFFMDDLRGELCRLAAYNFETDAEAVDGWLNTLLDESYQFQSRLDNLLYDNLKVFYPVERIKADGSKEHFVCAYNITPQEPAASEVINYGYNMLLKNPYNLQSDHNYTANTILLDGILVKDPATLKTRLHARVGENLRFELLYKTNNAYMTDVGGVRVRWEITDVTSSGNTTVLRDIWDSEVYNEESDIYFEFQPSYKTFSILCKVYREMDVQDVLADASLVTLEDKYNSLSPVRSITLASYTLTDRVTNRQAELKEFDLTTAGGMVPWLERFVLWDIDVYKENSDIYFEFQPSYKTFSSVGEVYR